MQRLQARMALHNQMLTERQIKDKTGHDPQTYDGMRALLEMMEGSDAESKD